MNYLCSRSIRRVPKQNFLEKVGICWEINVINEINVIKHIIHKWGVMPHHGDFGPINTPIPNKK